MDINTILEWMIATYTHPWVIVWILVELMLILLLVFAFKKFPKSWFVILMDYAFEQVYTFFEEILWIKEKAWIKSYITTLFFIILISNLFWVVLELFLPIFGHGMEHYIKIPTADINFNLAMAIIWVSIVIIEQFKVLWFWKFTYEYFPIFGKDYIPYEKWKLPKYIDLPLYWLVKIFDIVISVFLGVLEIVWHLAKLISLSFRLFWNVTSGWLLLSMLVAAMSALTISIFNVNFPVVAPIIIYLQEILVSFIQALVFPLLIAIFIKVAKVH